MSLRDEKLSKKNLGDHGEKSVRGFMEERFSMSYNQAYPRVPRDPRGRFVFRRAQLLRHFLHRSECIRTESGHSCETRCKE
jgi:hypothetical protein